ncbi:site-specific DNA-methyltransferase, partial [bacterium]|nr:site-specific DNA-methyltransferase [bacterium]
RSKEEQAQSQIAIDDVFKRDIANNVWHIAPIPPNQAVHPCAYPEEIPYRLISLYSYRGDVVLDPYMGVGTTPKVANALGRKFAGYEISERYYSICCQRIHEKLQLRKLQLIARYDKMAHEQDQVIQPEFFPVDE